MILHQHLFGCTRTQALQRGRDGPEAIRVEAQASSHHPSRSERGSERTL